MITPVTKVVFLICCHCGPADHFATFAEELTKERHEVQVLASDPALKKSQDRNIEIKTSFIINNLSKEEESQLATSIVKTCSRAFPAFLQFLSEGIQETELSNFTIFLQQHPGAKSNNLISTA